MYSVGSSLPVDGLEPGSTLLVTGPPMTGKRELVMSLLAAGLDEDGVAVVSTDASAADIRRSMAERVGRPADSLPMGVVDCVGDGHGTEGLSSLDSRVSSPADLTGVGMELTNLLERLYTGPSTRIRFGLLALTTMSMYADPEQVVRFLHVVTNRITDIDGLGLVVAHSDTMDEEHLQQLRSFVDGVIEVREQEDGRAELRVLGLSGGTTDWTPFERGGIRQSPAPDTTERVPADVPIAGSLAEILDDIRSSSPTLTVCNYDGDPETMAVIERYFDRHGVAVRQASLDVDHPRSVALLHHDDDLLGTESVTALRTAIDLDTSTSGDFGQRRTSDLLTNLERSVFGAAAADKRLLVDVSHTIELQAYRAGRGRLHAGFQRLSNLVDDEQAARIYERLSESGVDVHVYGVPDTVTNLSGVTVHEVETDEIRESWFVSYDGAGDPEQTAALLSVEIDDTNEYNGFWTYDDDIVRRIDAYLAKTYAEGATVEP